MGWRGASAHIDVLNNSGGIPNDDIGTLQGVDNIEVLSQRLRLFEAWVEQAWGDTSIRAGLYDLNSEFYSNDSAGLLMAPAFGIGSEVADLSIHGAGGARGALVGQSFLRARGRHQRQCRRDRRSRRRRLWV